MTTSAEGSPVTDRRRPGGVLPSRESPAPAEAPAGAQHDDRGIGAALLRFRVVAYLVGVGLIIVVFVGMPLRYIGDSPGVSETVSPIHGLVYMVYLALTVDLAMRCRFTTKRTVMIMLAGTVPFLSFVAERKISVQVRKSLPSQAQ